MKAFKTEAEWLAHENGTDSGLSWWQKAIYTAIGLMWVGCMAWTLWAVTHG